MLKVTDSTFHAEVITSKIPVVVKFEAEWCHPCKAMKPLIDAMAKDLDGQVRFVIADVDDCRSSVAKYMVGQVPALVVFKDGCPVGIRIGLSPKAQIRSWIDSVLL
jgi:thioredoxin 1